MKLRYIAAGACILAASAAVSADEFYIDVGVDFGGNSNTANGPTTTGWLEELQYQYTSNTEADCAAVDLPSGCNIFTSGGVDLSGSMADAVGSITENVVDGTTPKEVFNFGPSGNGIANDWGLTFAFDLTGTIGGPQLATDYTQGNVTFYYYDNNTFSAATTSNDPMDAFLELFSFNIYDTIQSSGGPKLFGQLTSVGSDIINGVNAGDMFNLDSGTFKDFVDTMANVVISLDFNTDPGNVDISDNGDGTSSLAGTHSGSFGIVNVPEPSTIALMGLGLLGLVGSSRRRMIK